MTTTVKSIGGEAHQTLRAMELIRLGARMQVLESELPSLSRDRLIRLYREVKGGSPPKGMLPFSADWFLTWAPNIHASMFANVYAFMQTNSPELERVGLLTRAFSLYSEHFLRQGEELQMDLTRAWTLLRFWDAGILNFAQCKRCRGRFVAHPHDLTSDLVCGICAPPSRAGKKKAAKERALQPSLAASVG